MVTESWQLQEKSSSSGGQLNPDPASVDSISRDTAQALCCLVVLFDVVHLQGSNPTPNQLIHSSSN
jgi:hypothetical protein